MKKQKKISKIEEVQLAAPKSLVKTYLYILAALAFLLFANTISNGYNLDDELVTKNHPLTSRGTEAIGEIFTSPYYSDEIGYAYGYRPIVHVSFAIEHQFFGESPKVSHFINVLLFVLAVVGFFKLLVRWAGEKQLLIAFLATLIFVVHPIHTEVVASIKNRDEILAFLFVIYSALSLEKYLEKGKFTSLIWIFVMFTLAMLSKKSAFPMAIFLPVAAIFLKDISWKKILLISIPLLIPAVPIAAEYGWKRIGLITLVSIISIALAYAIKRIDFKAIPWKKILMDERLWGSISVLILTYGVWEENLYFLFSAIFVLIVGIRKNEQMLIYLFVLEGLVLYSLFPEKEIIQFIIVLVLSYFLHCNKKMWFFLFLIVLATYVNTLLQYNSLQEIRFIGICFLFILSLRWRWYGGVIFGILILIILILRKDVELFPIYFIIFSCLHFFLKKTTERKHATPLFLSGALILFSLLLFPSRFENSNESQPPFLTQEKNSEMTTKSIPKMNFKDKDELFLKEGRMLEVVENDLVLTHSKSEFVATGFSTLGEYIRLYFFPVELNFYYGFAKVKTLQLTHPWVIFSVLAHVLLVLLSIFQLKKRPLLSLGIVWYLISILLFSNWVELVAGVVGERLAFLASAGLSISFAACIVWIKAEFSFRKPKLLEFSLIFVLALFSLKTVIRNSQWSSHINLMESDMPHLKSSAQANNVYASIIFASTFDPTISMSEAERQERYQLALKHFNIALEVYPSFYNAAFDRGRVAELLKDTTLAIKSYKQAIEMHESNLPDPFYNITNLYFAQKDFANYLKFTKPLIYYDSMNVNPYNNLARGYFLNNKKDSAVIVLENAIKKFPQDLDLKRNLEVVKNGMNE